MDKRIIIGLGTGRCGTVSFSNLLGLQGISSTHEHKLLPWNVSIRDFNIMMDILKKRPSDIVADTSFYWLPYLPLLLPKYADMLKMVCLKRNKQDTIESYIKKTKGRNHWCDDGYSSPDDKWDKCYPVYKDLRIKRDAIGRYWDEYYLKADIHEKTHGNNFKVFDFSYILNTDKGQRELFNFLELDNFKIYLDIVKNTSNK